MCVCVCVCVHVRGGEMIHVLAYTHTNLLDHIAKSEGSCSHILIQLFEHFSFISRLTGLSSPCSRHKGRGWGRGCSRDKGRGWGRGCSRDKGRSWGRGCSRGRDRGWGRGVCRGRGFSSSRQGHWEGIFSGQFRGRSWRYSRRRSISVAGHC